MKKLLILTAAVLLAGCTGQSVKSSASSAPASEGPKVSFHQQHAETETPERKDNILGSGIPLEAVTRIYGFAVGQYDDMHFDLYTTPEGKAVAADEVMDQGEEKVQCMREIEPYEYQQVLVLLDGLELVDIKEADAFQVQVEFEGMTEEDKARKVALAGERYSEIHSAVAVLSGSVDMLPENESLAMVRQWTETNQDLIACAVVGTGYGDSYEAAREMLMDEKYFESYPFTYEINEDHFICLEDGTALYLIVPVSEDTQLAVNDMDGNVLYRADDGAPILVMAGIDGVTCEVSAVQGDAFVTFYPCEDDYDGSLLLPNGGGVYDMTMWPQPFNSVHQAEFDFLYYGADAFREGMDAGNSLWYCGHMMLDMEPCIVYQLGDGDDAGLFAVTVSRTRAYRYNDETYGWEELEINW